MLTGGTEGVREREADATWQEQECRTRDGGTQSKVCHSVGPSKSEAENSSHPENKRRKPWTETGMCVRHSLVVLLYF